MGGLLLAPIPGRAVESHLTRTSPPAVSYFEVSGWTTSGDYGGTETTDVYALEGEYGYVGPRYDFAVIVPVISVSNAETTSGLGDVLVSGGAMLKQGGWKDVSLRGEVDVKLPTADDDLGTGATDVGVFVNGWKPLESWILLFSGGYVVNGDSGGVEYDDVFYYGLGASRFFTRTYAYVTLEGSGSEVGGADAPLALFGGGYYRIDPRRFLTGELQFGLSDGSPDSGIRLGLSTWF